MRVESESVLYDFSVSHYPESKNDRMRWYFDRFWLGVADQFGYPYPAAFPEGSHLYLAYKKAHSKLCIDLAKDGE